jgi:hypothetical protein
MTRLIAALALTGAVAAALVLLGREPTETTRTPVVPLSALAAERATHSLCATHGPSAVQTANVNLIREDAVTAKGPEKGCATPQNEPTVAIDPVDARNVVAGANDFRTCCDSIGDQASTGWAYVSKDAGATWTNVQVPGLTRETGGQGPFARFDLAEDPVLAFDAHGRLYYAHIAFAQDSAASGIAVSSSDDGGLTWNAPVLVRYTDDPKVFNDKEWITTAPDGTVVVTWTRFKSGSFGSRSAIVGSMSRDGGRTWTKPFALSSKQHIDAQGSTPVVARDGTLYVVFEAALAPRRKRAIAAAIVRPGQKPVYRTLAPVFDAPNCYAINVNLRTTLSDEAFRVSAIPSVSLDPASQTLAVAWADGERGCKENRFWGATNAQVKLVFLHGTHASGPRIVTKGADKALPSVAYRDRQVVVGYYTRSFAPHDCVYETKLVCLDYAYSTSADQFATERRLSDGSFNPYEQFDGEFIGDYGGLAVGPDGLAHAVWTDSRGGDQNIYSQAFRP